MHGLPGTVWVFTMGSIQMPLGVFSSVERASMWIAEHHLTGVLWPFPLDGGVPGWTQRAAFVGRRGKPMAFGVFSSGDAPVLRFRDGALMPGGG